MDPEKRLELVKLMVFAGAEEGGTTQKKTREGGILGPTHLKPSNFGDCAHRLQLQTQSPKTKENSAPRLSCSLRVGSLGGCRVPV